MKNKRNTGLRAGICRETQSTRGQTLLELLSALLIFLALFGDVVLELGLQLAQLAHLRAELEGAADGENGVHQINAGGQTI